MSPEPPRVAGLSTAAGRLNPKMSLTILSLQVLRSVDRSTSCPPALTKFFTTSLAAASMSSLRQGGDERLSCSGITSESLPASAVEKASAEMSVNGVTFSPNDCSDAMVFGELCGEVHRRVVHVVRVVEHRHVAWLGVRDGGEPEEHGDYRQERNRPRKCESHRVLSGASQPFHRRLEPRSRRKASG